MSSAVAEVKNTSRAVTHQSRPLLAEDVLRVEAEQRRLLGEYVKSQMKDGEDYGVIPGTQQKKASDGTILPAQKALLKPGAEKLCSLFRCTPQFEVVEKTENWDKPFFYYQFRVLVVSNDTGAVVAEGFGSANSRESKWRWRNADRTCPDCGQPAIKRSKFPPKDQHGNELDAEPGWYCFGKAGGCGANFEYEDPDILGQTTGRVENPDICDQVNTILKIAKKRALVDAAISLARCSDMFTQDVDENEEDKPARPQQSAKKPGSNGHANGKAAAEPHSVDLLRSELFDLVGRAAVQDKTTAEEQIEKLLNHCRKSLGLKSDRTLLDFNEKWLKVAIDIFQRKLEKPSHQTTPSEPPPREPGVDADDDGPEDAELPPRHDEGNPVAQNGQGQAPADGSSRLPPAVADALVRGIHEAGFDWEQVRGRSAEILGGTVLPAGTAPADLTLDQAGKVQSWCQRQKQAGRRKTQAA